MLTGFVAEKCSPSFGIFQKIIYSFFQNFGNLGINLVVFDLEKAYEMIKW